MPHIEFQCKTCGHRFERLVFRGEEKNRFSCPECGEKDPAGIKPLPGAESLFEGIANFSSLAGDTN